MQLRQDLLEGWDIECQETVLTLKLFNTTVQERWNAVDWMNVCSTALQAWMPPSKTIEQLIGSFFHYPANSFPPLLWMLSPKCTVISCLLFQKYSTTAVNKEEPRSRHTWPLPSGSSLWSNTAMITMFHQTLCLCPGTRSVALPLNPIIWPTLAFIFSKAV